MTPSRLANVSKSLVAGGAVKTSAILSSDNRFVIVVSCRYSWAMLSFECMPTKARSAQ